MRQWRMLQIWSESSYEDQGPWSGDMRQQTTILQTSEVGGVLLQMQPYGGMAQMVARSRYLASKTQWLQLVNNLTLSPKPYKRC